jgi:hypothetical protein
MEIFAADHRMHGGMEEKKEARIDLRIKMCLLWLLDRYGT